jgi:hypothetical protein
MIASVVVALLAFWSTAASIRGLLRRKAFEIEIGPEAFRGFGVTIPRERITSVRRYADLHVKGVRIDRDDGAWLTIPVHLHHPKHVLTAFRAHGYPING